MMDNVSVAARARRDPRGAGALHAVARGDALWLALLCLFSLLPLWAASRHLTNLNDDAYITLTYVKSLVAGEGWRFNGGPETLGTTSPLFALVVATLARLLPFSIEQLAVGWSTLCWLAIPWLLFLDARTFRLSRAGAAVVALPLLSLTDWQGSAGMEASFLLAGLMAALWLAARGHAFACGLASALLFLVRPEGLAMVPLAGAWLLWQRRGWRTAARFVAGAVLPLALWGGYALHTFGAVLPNSAVAKVGQGTFWPGDPFVERLVGGWVPGLAARYGFSLRFSLFWPLLLLGLLWSARRATPLLLVALWGVVYVAGYALLRAPGYWWYVMPVLFALYLFLGLGLVALLSHSSRWLRGVGGAATLLVLALTLQTGVRLVRQSEGDTRAPTYRAVAAWLTAHTPPRSSVAFVEIGYLGYFSDNRIVDLVGLVEPRFTANGARLDLASNFWQAEPDYLLYSPDLEWLMGPIVRDERFAQRYRPVTAFANRASTPLTLYARVPPP